MAISASPATRARLGQEAARLLDRRDPGGFNQAMMELGATICLPRNPLCLLCPVAGDCQAREQGRQAELPVKLQRIEPVRIRATLLAIERAGRILLWRAGRGRAEARRILGAAVAGRTPEGGHRGRRWARFGIRLPITTTRSRS